MPRDAVSRTANVERTGRHKWVNEGGLETCRFINLYKFKLKFEVQVQV